MVNGIVGTNIRKNTHAVSSEPVLKSPNKLNWTFKNWHHPQLPFPNQCGPLLLCSGVHLPTKLSNESGVPFSAWQNPTSSWAAYKAPSWSNHPGTSSQNWFAPASVSPWHNARPSTHTLSALHNSDTCLLPRRWDKLFWNTGHMPT